MLATDVPLLPEIEISFQASRGKKINIVLVVNVDALGLKPMQNLWHEYFDATNVFWTDHTFPQRLVVVQLRSEFAEKSGDEMLRHIDEVKYDWKGINGSYYGGDNRSWQRYTTELPIEGKIQLTSATVIRFILNKALKPSTWYAVVLLHSNHNFVDAIYDDFLIPFKTISATGLPLPQNVNIEKSPASPECCVCMAKPVSLVYLPCGHVCCCEVCDTSVKQCPKCRSAIQSKHKIFL